MDTNEEPVVFLQVDAGQATSSRDLGSFKKAWLAWGLGLGCLLLVAVLAWVDLPLDSHVHSPSKSVQPSHHVPAFAFLTGAMPVLTTGGAAKVHSRHGLKLRGHASKTSLAMMTPLPPLPARGDMHKTLSISTQSNWVIVDRLMEGTEPDLAPEGVEGVDADVIKEMSLSDATKFIKALRELVREKVLYVHSSADQGNARVVCATLLALMYDVSAAEGIARADAYATLRKKKDAASRMSDAQKSTVESVVQLTRQSDCAENE